MTTVNVTLTANTAPARASIAELMQELHEVDRRHPPEFDAMVPEQERLAVDFAAEICRSGGVDPVRLLEMAEALYKAEMGQ